MNILPLHLSLDIEALSEFMIDPQPAGSFVVIDAEWLQAQLKLLDRQKYTITHLEAKIADKNNRIEMLKQKITLLELQQPKAINIRMLDIKA